MKNKEKQSYENILKQHTALTTFKVTKGKYFNLQCEKIIFHLLKSKQNEMYQYFYSLLEKELKNIFSSDKFGKDIIDQIYKKEFSVENFAPNGITVNKYELDTLYRKINEFNELTENTYKKLSAKQREYCDIQVLAIKPNLSTSKLLPHKTNEISLKLNEKEILSIIKDVKTYARQSTILKFALPENLDLTTLGNQVGITNITNLKKYLLEAQETRLLFNFINLKKIEVEIDAPYITGITFISHKGKGTIFNYQIPIAILSLNLLPEIYAPLNELEVQKMAGKYTFRIYSLLKDHVNRGALELTKEQLKECLDLTDRTISNASTLKKNVLDPAIIEINEISNLECTYELIPPKRYKNILFKMRTNSSKVIEVLKVVKDEDEKLNYKDDEDILKKVEHIKHNIFISKAWDKRVENKINKLLNEVGKSFVLETLDDLYNNLKTDIEITLVAYINGILKNKKLANKSKTRNKISSVYVENNKNIREKIKEKKVKKKLEEIEDAVIIDEKDNRKNEVSYNIDSALKYYYSLNDNEQKKLENIFLKKCSKEKSVPIEILLQLKKSSQEFYNETIGEYLLKVLNSELKREKITKKNLKEYIENLSEYDLLKLEEEAVELLVKETNTDINFILDMKVKSRESYDKILEKYYLDIINRI
ncbi:replication initiation protein [Fusobacterium mortiferum]|uniref:Replication initiation protein n=1 Tax=Fusobacterium mortiferum TaxID=850 RepID=A0ABS2G3Y3_FUSMR|nr:replication initiation protein [Fusobacterium mortiferum]